MVGGEEVDEVMQEHKYLAEFRRKEEERRHRKDEVEFLLDSFDFPDTQEVLSIQGQGELLFLVEGSCTKGLSRRAGRVYYSLVTDQNSP